MSNVSTRQIRLRADAVARSLYEDLSRRILSGDILPGERIEGEVSLANRYGICRNKVRQVLARLGSQGLVRRRRGQGTHVREPLVDRTPAHESRVGTLRVLTYWPTLGEESLLRAVASFHVVCPDIRVELVRVGVHEQLDELASLTQKGQVPDLVYLPAWALAAVCQRVRLKPVDEILDPGALTDLYPAVRDSLTLGARLLAYPFVFSPVMLAYNRTAFEEAGHPLPDAGWNWEKWVAAMDALNRDIPGLPRRYGMALSRQANRWGVFIAQGGGAAAMDWSKVPAMTRPGVAEACQTAYELSQRSSVAPSGGLKPEELFAHGHAAMVLCNLCAMRPLMTRNFETDVAPVPAGPRPGTVLVCSGLAVPSAAKSSDLAREFLSYIASPEAQMTLRCSGAAIPPRMKIAENEEFYTNFVHPRSFHLYREALRDAHILERGAVMPVRLGAEELFGKFWTGLLDAREMCAQIDALIARHQTAL